MFEDAVKKAEAGARAEAIRGQLREEIRPVVQSGSGVVCGATSSFESAWTRSSGL